MIEYAGSVTGHGRMPERTVAKRKLRHTLGCAHLDCD